MKNSYFMKPFECLFYIFIVLYSKLSSKTVHPNNYHNTFPYFVEKDEIFLSWKYRVIYKSHRDFRPLWYSSRDGPATHVQRVGQELDYRIDICHVTKGGYIEHL